MLCQEQKIGLYIIKQKMEELHGMKKVNVIHGIIVNVLIALALFEEWDAFNLGVEWFFNNLNQDGLIYPEFKNNQHIHDHFESHHAPYIILPLMQAVLMGKGPICNILI